MAPTKLVPCREVPPAVPLKTVPDNAADPASNCPSASVTGDSATEARGPERRGPLHFTLYGLGPSVRVVSAGQAAGSSRPALSVTRVPFKGAGSAGLAATGAAGGGSASGAMSD